MTPQHRRHPAGLRPAGRPGSGRPRFAAVATVPRRAGFKRYTTRRAGRSGTVFPVLDRPEIRYRFL